MMRREVTIGGATIGGAAFAVIAGPCSIESRDQLLRVARQVRDAGASGLRGGVFKMRSDPSTFQGLGAEALPLVDEARLATGLPFVAEVTCPQQIELLAEHVDMLQVGSRNMHNTALLKELGRQPRPVLLKRGFAALLQEWLWAAEYVAQGGNDAVVLCERGIRTFGEDTRNTIDLAGAVLAKQRSGLPVLLDPSHGTGRPELIGPMCAAAAAAGLDGLLIEVHDEPTHALSDGFQSLTPAQFAGVVAVIQPFVHAAGRQLRSGAITGTP